MPPQGSPSSYSYNSRSHPFNFRNAPDNNSVSNHYRTHSGSSNNNNNNRQNLSETYPRRTLKSNLPFFNNRNKPQEIEFDVEWRKTLRVDKCKKSDVKNLMRMGFTEDQAVQALIESNYQPSQAASLLLGTR